MSMKKAALVPTLVLALTVITVASAFAQASPTNPSGGTSLRLATEEGSGSTSPAGFLSRNLWFNTGWQSWFGTFAAARSASLIESRWSGARSLLAVARRQTWRP